MAEDVEETQFERSVEELKRIRERMALVGHKIAVFSGKGGVGKSLVTVNLAAALAVRGLKVGVLDADLHGPTVPKMLGLKGERLHATEQGTIRPVEGIRGIEVVSMDFLLSAQSEPVIWRGPLKMSALRQFLADVEWGALDYLLVDLPPGTGDESLSMLQLLPDITGAVIVTIPSEVSGDVVEKSVTFARQMKAPVIGLVENMGYLICPRCGEKIHLYGEGAGERVSREMGIPLLGSIPLDPEVSRDSDRGTPFVLDHPDSEAAREFGRIVDKIVEYKP